MHIKIIFDEKFYNPGDVVPESAIISKVPHGDLLFLPGEINPEGEEVLIDCITYVIGNKFYELDGYALKAVVRDNNLIPVLRSARGDERYTLTRLVKETPRHQAKRVGEITLWWPTIVKTFEEEQEVDNFVKEAINVIEEIDEINENFDLIDNSIEYYEEEGFIE